MSGLARLPNSGGISPLNWFSLRSSRTTQPICVDGDAVPFSDWRTTQPVVIAIPIRTVGGAVEGDQRRLVADVVARSAYRQIDSDPPAARQVIRYAPVQMVPMEVQRSQIGEVAQLRRYLPGQLVVDGGRAFPD